MATESNTRALEIDTRADDKGQLWVIVSSDDIQTLCLVLSLCLFDLPVLTITYILHP